MIVLPKTCFVGNLGQDSDTVVGDFAVLFFSSDLDDLSHLFFRVGSGGNDDHSVKQVDGDAMRRLVLGTADPSDASVGGHHDDGCHVVLKGAVEEAKAFDVKHVNLKVFPLVKKN